MRTRLTVALLSAFVLGAAVGRLGVDAVRLSPTPPTATAATSLAVASATIPTAVPPTPGPSFVNPTATQTPPPFPPVPVVLGSDDAAATIAFAERSGNWVYEGHSGTLGVLGLGTAAILTPQVLAVTAPLADWASAYDTRTRFYPRLLPQESALPGSVAVSTDGTRVAYLTPQRRLHIAFQQPFGNVDGRALAADRIFGGALRISPSGSEIVLAGTSLHDRDPSRPFSRLDGYPLDLWVVDVGSGAVRQVMCSYDPCPRGLSPSATFVTPLSWSPDERYVLVRTPSAASGVDAEGTDNYVLDTTTGAMTNLGPAVDATSWRTWAAPHTLYFASGKVSLQPGTPPTRLRRWSPEDGIADVSAPGVAVVSPSYDAARQRVFYVEGRTEATRHVDVLDVQSGALRAYPNDPRYAVDGVRVSADGTTLLELRREVSTGSIEIWIANSEGDLAHPLIRFGTGLPAIDDIYTLRLRGVSLDAVAWSRS